MRCVVSAEKLNFGGLVAQWITRLTTDQKIPGSNPGKLENFGTSANLIKRQQSLCESLI